MKKAALFAAALFLTPMTLAPVVASAQTVSPTEMPAGIYAVDPAHASVTFKVSHFGLSNYTARFKHFDAKIDFDPKDVTKSKVSATIDTLSLETDYPYADKKDFNKEISAEDKWLNGTKFPTITFVSTKLEKTGETTGKMYGNLTLLGVTKEVVLDVTYNAGYAKHPMSGQPIMGFSATGTVKRTDFGFSTFAPAIGEDVKVIIEAEFPKAP